MTYNRTTQSVIIANPCALESALGPELAEAVDYARASRSAATRRAYCSDFEIFRAWCNSKGLSPLPASVEAVAAFLAFDVTNGTKPTTLSRRLAAIRYAHAGLAPAVEGFSPTPEFPEIAEAQALLATLPQ